MELATREMFYERFEEVVKQDKEVIQELQLYGTLATIQNAIGGAFGRTDAEIEEALFNPLSNRELKTTEAQEQVLSEIG